MYSDDLIARVHNIAGVAQDFLFSVRPFQEQTSLAAIDDLCRQLREAELPPLCYESIIHRVLKALQRDMAVAHPSLMEMYWSCESRLPNPIDRLENCLKQLVRSQLDTPERVHQALAVLARRATESTLTLTDVARDVNVSAKHLSHLLTATTGRGFRQHLRLLRLYRAGEMLRQRSGSIKEVWAAVGYKHASEFDRHFKEYYGSTPRAYRNSVSGNPLPSQQEPVLQPNQHVDSSPVAPHYHSNGVREDKDITGSAWLGRVLIVDDDAMTAMAFDRLLRHAGYETLTAENTQGAVRAAAGFEPDVAILDYRMPGENGVECIRILRTVGLTKTRFLMLTGDCSVVEHADELAATQCVLLFKPLDPIELLFLVKVACDAGVTSPS